MTRDGRTRPPPYAVFGSAGAKMRSEGRSKPLALRSGLCAMSLSARLNEVSRHPLMPAGSPCRDAGAGCKGVFVLELRQVSKRYGDKTILRNVSLRLEAGSTYGLVGVNGAGKTTFLKIVKRLIAQHEGEVFLRGSNITNKDANDVSISYVCDTPAFFSDLVMEEQMLLVAKARGLSKQEALKRMERYAEKLELISYLGYYPHALSRGTQQRFNTVLSFLGDCDLYLYDEPFITLDPVQVRNLESVFAERRSQGLTQVVSSHNLESLERICDTYLVLSRGGIESFSQEDADEDRIMRYLNESDRGIC